MNIRQDLKELKVNTNLLKPKYKSLEGTREIIQYEGKDFVFTLSKTWKPKIKAYGVTNRCDDGKFVLFLEYDNIYKELMYKNLRTVLSEYQRDLDNFYIAATEPEQHLEGGQTKGSYHVVNFVKNKKETIQDMVGLCDVDPFFREIPIKTAHKTQVLRISEKFWRVNGQIMKQAPFFIEIYPRYIHCPGKKCSDPHFKLFSKTWGFPRGLLPHNFDKLKKVEMHKYSTPKVQKNG